MDKKTLRELKLKKGEDFVIFTSSNGKAVFYCLADNYMREVKTDIDADISVFYDIRKTVWTSVLQFFDFADIKELSVKSEGNLDRLCIAGKEFEVSIVPDLGDYKFITDKFVAGCLLPANDVARIKNLRLFCSSDRNRYHMQFVHFAPTGEVIATDAKHLASINGDKDFCQWIQGVTGYENPLENGNIPAVVFDQFDGKKDLHFFQSESGQGLKVIDGFRTVYTDLKRIQFPNYEKVIPDVTKDYIQGTVRNLSNFADKILLKVLKEDNYKVVIKDGFAKTVEGIPICEIGNCSPFTVLEGFVMNGEFLGDVSKTIGDCLDCYYNPCNKMNCVMFRNVANDFALVMPMRNPNE